MISPRQAALVVGLQACVAAATAGAAPRFAVVNTSGAATPRVLVDEIEREVARLRPGYQVIDDPALRTLLATGEEPAAAVARLVGQAELKRQAGACDEAIPPAMEAEDLALRALSLDQERDLLKRIYVLAVQCEDLLGRADRRAIMARRLRGLVSLRPDDLPEALWREHVENAKAGEATVELEIDSEPANAQIAINFHADGITPRTLNVAPGEVIVEVQKEGYKKAYRKLLIEGAPKRTVFRLIERRLDRVELAGSAMRILSTEDPWTRPNTLSQLSQWVRADTLIVIRTEGDAATGPKVRIWQFDAERGALARELIISSYDPETGRVQALAVRATPAAGPAVAGVLAPTSQAGVPTSPRDGDGASPDGASGDVGLPSTFTQRKTALPRRLKSESPWWGWAIAGAVAAGVVIFVATDTDKTAQTLDVSAVYDPRR